MNTNAHGMALSAPAIEPGMKEIETHFVKVAVAINEHSKALVSMRDQLTNLDRNSATAFELIAKSIAAIKGRLARLETEVAGLRPQIGDMKVHAASFPHALRSARRSDAAVQEAQKLLEEKLGRMELRLEACLRRKRRGEAGQ